MRKNLKKKDWLMVELVFMAIIWLVFCLCYLNDGFSFNVLTGAVALTILSDIWAKMGYAIGGFHS